MFLYVPGTQSLSVGIYFRMCFLPHNSPCEENIMYDYRIFLKKDINLVSLVLRCTVHVVHVHFTPKLLYFDTSLFQNLEITLIDLQLNTSFLRTIILFQCIITLKHCLSNTLSLHFSTENIRANIFFD